MLNNSLDITIGSEPITLNRLTMDGSTSTFAGTGLNKDVLIEVKHDFPKAGKVGIEQHLLKITVTEYDLVNGVYAISKVYSAHAVMKTSVGVEDDTKMTNLVGALTGFLQGPGLPVILQRRV